MTHSSISNRAARVFLVLAALVLAVSVGGCAQQKHEDLVQYMESVKASKQGRVDPLPEVKPYVTQRYVAGDVRDPFTPVVERARAAADDSGVRPDQHRKREELEEVPLDALRFVGTVELAEARWAIVRAPDGKVHRVRTGNYIGQNDGRIHSVTERSLHLIELVPNGRGGWLEREASVVLSDRTH